MDLFSYFFLFVIFSNVFNKNVCWFFLHFAENWSSNTNNTNIYEKCAPGKWEGAGKLITGQQIDRLIKQLDVLVFVKVSNSFLKKNTKAQINYFHLKYR